MANLSNINNKFIVTSETEALIGATSWSGVGSGTLAAGLIISGNTSQFILDNPSYNHFTMYSAGDSNIYNIFGSSGNYLIGTGNKDTSSWSQKFRIDSSGRVGIGITPSLADVKLHTYNNSTNAYNIFESSTRKWVFGQVGDVAQVAGVYGLHGGVQVDGATGDVGIGTDSPGARIDIKGVAGSPATSGTTQNGILRIQNATNNNTLDIGQVAGSPYGTWLQAADKSDLNPTYTYPILLNPLGGDVGIGTISPQDKLEVKSGYIRLYDPSSNANAGYPIRWTSNNGGTNVTFAEISGVTTSAGNRTGDIYFSTSNSGAPTEKMRITSGGNVNFTGNTSANVVVSRDNMFVDAGQLYIGAAASNVDNTFRQAVTSGAFKIESRESGTWTQRLMIDTVGDLTIPGNIFASSIFLGGTATANKLNDYEEGTWTPSITAAGGNAATATYHNPVYTKVGRIVNVVVYIHTINIASITSGTYVLITGFPFTAENYGDFTASYHYGGWSGGVIVGGYVQDGQNYAYLMRADGVEAQQQTTDLVMTRFMLNVTYQTT